MKPYPWEVEATLDELTEGDQLYEAGWRGVSNKYCMIALFDEESYMAWLNARRNDADTWAAYQSYLRGPAPTKEVSFHTYRQIKRNENFNDKFNRT